MYAGSAVPNKPVVPVDRFPELAKLSDNWQTIRDEAEESALREVAVAYDELEAGLAQYDAAVALREAARTAFAADADAFRHGVGTITAASTAEAALDQANATLARTHAQVLASAASLAFASGQLTSATALPP